MLVDLPENWYTDPAHPYATIFAQTPPAFTHHSLGMYEELWDMDISHLIKSHHPFAPRAEAGMSVDELMKAIVEFHQGDGPRSFGVCDNPEQIVARWPQIAEDPRALLVYFRYVHRDAQPPSGGWRWEKWGDYIGERERTSDYLADERDIEDVCVFAIVELDTDAMAKVPQPAPKS